MSSRVIGGVVGGVIGFVVSGYSPYGAAVGWNIGYGVAGLVAGPDQPKLDPGDLTAPRVRQGEEIPRVYGTCILTANPGDGWVSGYRAEQSGGGGGKGDDGASDPAKLTYYVNMVAGLAVGTNVTHWVRIWRDGKLEATRDARSNSTSLAASAGTDMWRAVRLHTGQPDQLPPPTYEAAVGVDRAVAYRDRCTIEFEHLNCGGWKTLPFVRVEVTTTGTAAPGNVFWLLNFDGTHGATTAIDESSWANPVTLDQYAQDSAAAKFGVTGASSVASPSGTARVSGFASVPWDVSTEAMTIEAWVKTSDVLSPGTIVVPVSLSFGSGLAFSVGRVMDVSPVLDHSRVQCLDQVVDIPTLPLSADAAMHYELDWDPAVKTLYVFVDGELHAQVTYTGTPAATTAVDGYHVGSRNGGAISVDGARYTRRMLRHTSPFTPPAAPPTDDGGGVITVAAVSLADVLRAELALHPRYSAGLYDFSAVESLMVRGERCVGTVDKTIPAICRNHGVIIVPRGDAKAFVRLANIVPHPTSMPWRDTGCSVGKPADNGVVFAGFARPSDTVAPQIVGLKFLDYAADYEDGYRRSDRLTVPSSYVMDVDATDTVYTPSEALTRAVQLAHFAYLGNLRAQIMTHVGWLAHGPGDAIDVTDPGGRVWPTFVESISFDARGVVEWQLSAWDGAVGQLAAQVDESLMYPSVNVSLPQPSELTVIDAPMLDDAHDSDGLYLAVEPGGASGGTWSGATVQRSADGGVTWAAATTHATASVIGRLTSGLTGWAWGDGVIDPQTVTVDVGPGAPLTGSTRPVMAADLALNTAAVIHPDGQVEVIRFRQATLVAGTVFRLGQLTRGFLGTAASAVAAGARWVLLDGTLRRAPDEPAAINATRHYRARSLTGPIANPPALAFVNRDARQRPYPVARVHVARMDADWSVHVTRRSLFRVRQLTPTGIYVPSDALHNGFEARIYATSAYATVLRTLTGPTPLVYTAAQRAADGVGANDPLFIEVGGRSAITGLGPLRRYTA